MPPFIDLTGRRFGRLTAQERVGTTGYGQPRWRCRCDCGAEREVFANALRTCATQSCGCLRQETITTHGMTGTPEFSVWQMMRQRCENQRHTSYASYGGRGITVCERWRGSFAAFLEDMGKRPSRRHTLDRTDNAGDYEPRNCRWATPLQQGANKRNNRLLTHCGETLPIGEWCRRLDLRKSTVANRLLHGWSVDDALARPVRKHHRQAILKTDVVKSTVNVSPSLRVTVDP